MEKKIARIAKIFCGAAAWLIFIFLLVHANAASAATLYLSPKSANETVGQSFTVSVYVSSPDQSMNAAEGVINFPADKLGVISLSTANSIADLWVQQPSFSNKDGTINFQGVAVNPGFQGAAGRLITITFRARTAGSAALVFNSGSVLANDGKGTNILTALNPANFTISPASAPVEESPVPSKAPASSTDMIPPAPFTITELPGSLNDPTFPQPAFTWKTTDNSGIDKYLVRIGGGNWFDASAISSPDNSDIYQLPIQASGKDVSLLVDAYDLAGNVTEASTTFTVLPIAAPQITSYSHQITPPKQLLEVEGKTSAGARVVINLRKPGTNNLFLFSTTADQDGNWVIAEPVSIGPGLWTLRARATDKRGAVSPYTDDLPVNVGNWFTDAFGFLVQWGSIIIAGIALAAAIFGILYFIRHRYIIWRLTAGRQLLKIRRELRGDLKSLEKELENEEQGENIDLSPGVMKKRRERIRKEIEHIEEDLKKEVKAIDNIEKDE